MSRNFYNLYIISEKSRTLFQKGVFSVIFKNNNKNSTDKKYPKKTQESVMLKPREIIPIMAQSSDPLGSYSGIPAGNPYDKPVQDADDLWRTVDNWQLTIDSYGGEIYVGRDALGTPLIIDISWFPSFYIIQQTVNCQLYTVNWRRPRRTVLKEE